MTDNEDNLPPHTRAANPNPQNMVNVNKLKTIFSNPKADIPIFYGDNTKDSVQAKFM